MIMTSYFAVPAPAYKLKYTRYRSPFIAFPNSTTQRLRDKQSTYRIDENL